MTSTPYISDNRITNGDFLVDQINEGAAATPAATAYVMDRWKLLISGLGSDITAQNQTTTALRGFTNAAKLLVASSATPAAGNHVEFAHPVEGSNVADLSYGTSGAKTCILSFLAQASVTGTYCVSLRNSALNRSYVTTFSLGSANRWTRVNLTIPGDLSGTWLNTEGTVGLWLGFDLGAGSTFRTTANAWAAGNFTSVSSSVQLVANAAATLFIQNVLLYPGTVIYPQTPRTYAQEKNECLRFYQKTFPFGTAPAQNAGVTGAITVKNPIALGDPSEWWQFIPKMASTPTITTYNPSAANANWRDITAGADSTVSVDPSSTLGSTGVLIATSGTVATLGDVLAIHAVADAGP